MWVYIGWAKDYSAMRGPCPEGFHIPTNAEWSSLRTLLTNAQIIGSSSPWGSSSYDVLKTALKLPKAGTRDNSSSYVYNPGTYGFYWSSTAYSAGYAYYLFFNSSSLNPQNGRYRAYGFTIRPFSDIAINPMDGELLKEDWEYLDWNTMAGNVCAWNPTLKVISVVYNWSQVITIADRNLWATTTYDWDIYDENAVEPTLSEANCWKFYQWGNNYGFAYSGTITTSSTQVDASNYGPWNYYSSSTFITRSASPYDWSSVQNDNLRWGVTWVVSPVPLKNAYIGGLIDTPWIYHNATQWLISLSSDWKNWITIADKNLGATQVYNYGDTLSSANGGYVYQRWNNYWFPYTGSITTSTSIINASSYWPWNYYSSSTYRWSPNGYWDSSYNNNLWGNTTNTLEARQWPCSSWFHVAAQSERIALVGVMSSLWLTRQANYLTYLKVPRTWYRRGAAWGGTSWIWTNAYRWSSTPSTSWLVNYNAQDIAIESSISTTDNSGRASALPVRPIKNTPIIPDNSRTVLYQPS